MNQQKNKNNLNLEDKLFAVAYLVLILLIITYCI